MVGNGLGDNADIGHYANLAAVGLNHKTARVRRIVALAEGMHLNAKHIADIAWLLGYGYQMWRCPDIAYRADGARGQYIIVMPDQDAVIAITADSPALQAELENIYKYLFPVLKK